MTDAERRATLVEKVALAMSNVDWCGANIDGELCLCDDPRLPDGVRAGDCMCRKQAPAALTVALEEAARVCDPKGDCSEMDKYGEHYAAAIRALVKEDK
jgi:hypothetical protein